MVERVVYLGAATQVMLRLATGESLQAVIPNDESAATWAQGTPVHCFLPVDAIRVLAPASACRPPRRRSRSRATPGLQPGRVQPAGRTSG